MTNTSEQDSRSAALEQAFSEAANRETQQIVNPRKGTTIFETRIKVPFGETTIEGLNQAADGLVPNMASVNRRGAEIDSTGNLLRSPQISAFDSLGENTFQRTIVEIVPHTQK